MNIYAKLKNLFLLKNELCYWRKFWDIHLLLSNVIKIFVLYHELIFIFQKENIFLLGENLIVSFIYFIFYERFYYFCYLVWEEWILLCQCTHTHTSSSIIYFLTFYQDSVCLIIIVAFLKRICILSLLFHLHFIQYFNNDKKNFYFI